MVGANLSGEESEELSGDFGQPAGGGREGGFVGEVEGEGEGEGRGSEGDE